MRRFVGYYALPAAVLSVAGIILGCGGGASTEPTVTVKPAADVVGGNTSGGGDAPATDGKADEPGVAGGIGSLVGKVVYQGTPPNLPPLIPQGTAQRDGNVCAATMNIPDESLVVGEGGGLANVFIYLDKAPTGAKIPEVPSEPLVFDQKECIFLQHAFLARAGQTVLVKSDDPIAHNTHTFPKRNSPFNSTIKPNDREGVPLVYDKAEREPFEVKCDLHTWMRSFHLPLDHPYAAVSKSDGTFEIPELPSGKHDFRIWHERAGFVERAYSVTVKPDEPTQVEIVVDGGKLQ